MGGGGGAGGKDWNVGGGKPRPRESIFCFVPLEWIPGHT